MSLWYCKCMLLSYHIVLLKHVQYSRYAIHMYVVAIPFLWVEWASRNIPQTLISALPSSRTSSWLGTSRLFHKWSLQPFVFNMISGSKLEHKLYEIVWKMNWSYSASTILNIKSMNRSSTFKKIFHILFIFWLLVTSIGCWPTVQRWKLILKLELSPTSSRLIIKCWD